MRNAIPLLIARTLGLRICRGQARRLRATPEAGIKPGRPSSGFADDDDGWRLVLAATAGATVMALALGGFVWAMGVLLHHGG